MTQNTIVKFRPSVTYLKSDANYLKVRANGKSHTFELPDGSPQNLSPLVEGLPVSQIASTLLEHLTSLDIVEVLPEEKSLSSVSHRNGLLFRNSFNSWQHMDEVQNKIKDNSVFLLNLTTSFEDLPLLKDLGLQIKTYIPGSIVDPKSFVVVVCSSLEDKRLMDINRTFVAQNTAWVLMVINSELQIGPFFHSKSLGCFSCFYARLQSKDAISKAATFEYPLNESLLNYLIDTMSIQILRIHTTATDVFEYNIQQFDPTGLRCELKPFFIYPKCGVCR